MAENPGVQITVGTSGTGGGFEKFCAGDTDMSNASRPIKPDDASEGPACESNGIEYTELQIANDGLSVVVNKDNDWVDCLTVEQLKTIWEPAAEGKVTNWNQVDPSFPDEPLELFGAGTDSGTFDYFTDAINGEEGASRTDYTATEDDNVTVQGVGGSTGGLGYFGLSYYEENSDTLKALEIDAGDGCVAPSTETVQSGEYTPLIVRCSSTRMPSCSSGPRVRRSSSMSSTMPPPSRRQRCSCRSLMSSSKPRSMPRTSRRLPRQPPHDVAVPRRNRLQPGEAQAGGDTPALRREGHQGTAVPSARSCPS